MVTVELPAVDAPFEVSVSTLVPVVLAGENDAMTPLGRPVAASATVRYSRPSEPR